MRPVSGDDLVTAALQSSLARAQKSFKLSNKKRLHLQGDSGNSDKNFVSRDGEKSWTSTSKKLKSSKIQSEFDLWIEQASKLTFTSEGYVNGATIPSDIECLNLTHLKTKAATRVSIDTASTSVSGAKHSGKLSGSAKKISEGIGANVNGSSATGKTKYSSSTFTENSFELLQNLKESRKQKKKLTKLRKRLLKEGKSLEETEKLINQAKNSTEGVGAIFQKLREAALFDKRGKEASKASKAQITGSKQRMRDVENGETATSSSGPGTPPARHQPLTSPTTSTAVVNGNQSSNGGSNGTNNTPNGGNQHQLPQPKRVLYPRDKIVPGYIEKMPVGTGFYNMGNSCYLNASLQAVFHVPAFINWLKHDAEHRRNCQDNPNCIICAMKKTLDSAMSRQNSSPTAIKPVEIITRLRSICRHFSHGRQEDAHEFLRYLFESMERSYLAAINGHRLDNRSKETNPLGQIFGGYLRTEVTCLKCHYVSTTFQPTAELQLDIRHVTSLEDAILNHFKKERLDNNDYKCEKCRTISQATKQFSLEIPPIVLCLQLKRFTLYGTKISKRIHCNRYLDMSKFMHKSKQVNGFSNLRYRLVALVTHLGSSPNCGHYTAIAEAANGNFYQFDDSYVHQVTVSNALNNDAYVIIYEMDKEKRTYKSSELSSSSSSAATSTSSFSTNVSNISFRNTTSTVTSTNTLFPKKMPSTPIPKISASSSTSPSSKLVQTSDKVSTVSTSSSSSAVQADNGSCGSPAIAGNTIFKPENGIDRERKMISFGIRPTNKINILKQGASLTNSAKLATLSSSNGNGAITASSTSTRNEIVTDKAFKLVPYNDDENEESDNENAKSVLPLSKDKDKRLKSPDCSRQSPKKNKDEFPITPPKSPKPSPDACLRNVTLSPVEQKSCKDVALGSETASPGSSQPIDNENKHQRDGVKRKAPTDDEMTPKKSGSQRSRQSSSSSDGSSRSTSSSPDNRCKNGSNKRKRGEDSTRSSDKNPSLLSQNSNSDHNSRRERDSSNRDSYSQERDRERRKDRNPSPNPREKRGSSMDHRQLGPSGKLGEFDVARIKNSNSILGWDGQKSLLSKSMEEDRKRFSEKQLDDEYNDEFDLGRIKKVRRSLSVPRETEGNRFQSIEDKKRQVNHWSSVLDGSSSTMRRSTGSSDSDSKSWTNGDDSSRHRSNSSRSDNTGGNSSGPRPRHSNSNNSHLGSNYSKNSHGRRSPYKNGHHSNNGGGGSHYRSQSHSSYHHHHSSNNKHWNGSGSRSRYN